MIDQEAGKQYSRRYCSNTTDAVTGKLKRNASGFQRDWLIGIASDYSHIISIRLEVESMLSRLCGTPLSAICLATIFSSTPGFGGLMAVIWECSHDTKCDIRRNYI
jgi:hypothetical protein